VDRAGGEFHLLDHYGFELARDTRSTWRIGRRTAAFYNYIYYNVQFTENETFRIIRYARSLNREKALELSEQKTNALRVDKMYCIQSDFF